MGEKRVREFNRLTSNYTAHLSMAHYVIVKQKPENLETNTGSTSLFLIKEFVSFFISTVASKHRDM